MRGDRGAGAVRISGAVKVERDRPPGVAPPRQRRRVSDRRTDRAARRRVVWSTLELAFEVIVTCSLASVQLVSETPLLLPSPL